MVRRFPERRIRQISSARWSLLPDRLFGVDSRSLPDRPNATWRASRVAIETLTTRAASSRPGPVGTLSRPLAHRAGELPPAIFSNVVAGQPSLYAATAI